MSDLNLPTLDIEDIDVESSIELIFDNKFKSNITASFLNDVQVEINAFEGRRLRIKSNPGFPVLIKKEKFKNNLFIGE